LWTLLIKIDPHGTAGDYSPLGVLIKKILDSQPPEDRIDSPDFDEPVSPLVPAGGSTP
jgi:hypothetical protein